MIISLVTLYISYKVSNESLIMISAFWEAVVILVASVLADFIMTQQIKSNRETKKKLHQRRRHKGVIYPVLHIFECDYDTLFKVFKFSVGLIFVCIFITIKVFGNPSEQTSQLITVIGINFGMLGILKILFYTFSYDCNVENNKKNFTQ